MKITELTHPKSMYTKWQGMEEIKMQSIVSDLFILTQLITNKTNALSPGLLKF